MSADHVGPYSTDRNFSVNSVDSDQILHYAPSDPYADPGFFQGGGVRLDGQITVWTASFFIPQLILQFTEGVQRFYYRENYTFPRIQRGSRSKMLISI